MNVQVMFLDCPEYSNDDGSLRCGLPAEVQARYTLGSTDGPLDGVRISCPRGHWFNGLVESLIPPEPQEQVAQRSISGGGYREWVTTEDF